MGVCLGGVWYVNRLAKSKLEHVIDFQYEKIWLRYQFITEMTGQEKEPFELTSLK
jgi:hypothetical protein